MHRLALVIAGLLTTPPAAAVETLTFRDFGPGGRESLRTAVGRYLVEDSRGGALIEDEDGGRFVVAGDDVVSRDSDDRPFEPLDGEALGERMLLELPEGFRIHTTEHYTVAYDTSREYAEWASSLLESLQEALTRYWRRQGLELDEPRFPMGVVIHRSVDDYRRYAKEEIGSTAAVGYYSLRTNRVRMYDLTGSDEVRAAVRGARRSGSRRQITQMLSMPAAEPLVATIVHEATHQVAFNTGVLQRYADLPLWLVEGMAVYFEAPNAKASRGWRGIGKVNRRRMEIFVGNLPRWNRDSLRGLIESDTRLRDPRTAADAYADAWALTYFLIKRREEQYVAYVTAMAAKEPLDGPPNDQPASVTAQQRLDEFLDHFGELDKLERDFLRTMTRLR